MGTFNGKKISFFGKYYILARKSKGLVKMMLAFFIVGLVVVQGLNIPFQYKKDNPKALTLSGSSVNVADKQGLLVGKYLWINTINLLLEYLS